MDKIIRIKLDASQANADIKKFDSNMVDAGRSTDGLVTSLSRVAAAVASALSVSKVIAYADAYTSVQNKLRIVTDGTEQLNKVTAELLLTANNTRSSFEATADLYSKLTRSTEELGISQERLLAVTNTINKTFATAGASADEASNAIRQLGQGLASGALRGDEFNSIAENSPGILRAIAQETGKTIGELREFAATGGITSELLIRSIENYSETVDREFAKTNATFAQSAQIAENNAIAFVGANEQIAAASSAAGSAIVLLSENLDLLVDGLTLISAVIVGRYIGAFASSTSALVANTAASVATKVSYDALGVAISRTSATASAGAIAIRGLSSAFSLLGGPAGIVLLAASAIAIFGNNSKEAADKLKQEGLTAEIDKIVGKYKELNQQGRQVIFNQLTQQQLDLTNQLKAANAELERRKQLTQSASTSGFAGGATELAAQGRAATEVLRIETELNGVVAKQGALFESTLPAIESQAEAVKSVVAGFAELRTVSSGIDSLFSGDLNLFGADSKRTNKNQETQARINERLASLRQETALVSSELVLRQQVLSNSITQEDAIIQSAAERRLQKAVTDRDLILSEQFSTQEQQLEAKRLFEEQKLLIEQETELARTELARNQMLERMQIEQQTQDNYLSTTSIALDAIGGLLTGSKTATKALKLIQAGVNAFQIFASSQAAAFQILATPPGPVLNPSLGPLAASVIAKGKISAAAVLAAGAANTFGGGGGANIGSFGGGGSSSSTATLPTTPSATPTVQTVEIPGLTSLADELRNSDAQLPATYVARILDAVNSANRLRGEA